MRYTIKHHYTWSKYIAYATGLIASDGCLSSDGRHIDMTSVDLDQLANFQLAIGSAYKISEKFNSSSITAHRVQFSNVALYDFFVKVGLTPNKSKTIGELNVPDEFYADFLRGVFDGDGTTYGYFDKRWRSSFLYYVSITSASIEFLRFLSEQNFRLIHTSGTSIRKGTRSFSLAYAKEDSLKLYNYIYYSPDTIYLERKKNKFKNFIEIDRLDIIGKQKLKNAQVA